MTIKSAPFYWVECDRCGVSAEEGGDYASWGDAQQAAESADDAGFHIEGGNHVCENCIPHPPDWDDEHEAALNGAPLDCPWCKSGTWGKGEDAREAYEAWQHARADR